MFSKREGAEIGKTKKRRMLKVLKLGYPKHKQKRKKATPKQREIPGLINLLKYNSCELDKKEE